MPNNYLHEAVRANQFAYTVNDLVLAGVDNIRVLGVTLDSRLDLHYHIVATCKSAGRTMAFIMGVASQFPNSRTAVILYNAYARSKLEYNYVVWDPREKI